MKQKITIWRPSLSNRMDFPDGSDDKASAYNAGDPGSIPGSERSPGEGNGYPLQYSCLENPMDGGAWQAAVHGVTESRTQLSDFTFTFHFHAVEEEMATLTSEHYDEIFNKAKKIRKIIKEKVDSLLKE